MTLVLFAERVTACHGTLALAARTRPDVIDDGYPAPHACTHPEGNPCGLIFLVLTCKPCAIGMAARALLDPNGFMYRNGQEGCRNLAIVLALAMHWGDPLFARAAQEAIERAGVEYESLVAEALAVLNT